MKKSIFLVFLVALALQFATYSVVAAEAVSKLSWDAPTTRVDGTPLDPTEIAEFRIYYEVDIGDAVIMRGSEYTSVTGQNATDITVELTPRAEPYVLSFAVTTVDTDGAESALSETVTKTFEVDSTSEPGVPTSLQFTVTCGEGCVIKKKLVE